jgi:hypothetical protein
MKNLYIKRQIYIWMILFQLIFASSALAQMGIGTTTPDNSSMLDIRSTSKGFLAPRMTTAQRNAIISPANGLVVYDTDLSSLYFFNGTVWSAIGSQGGATRINYVLVKSEADFPTPAAGVITLDSQTLYEINGTVILNNSINLNGAYVIGVDTNEDKLVRVGGTIFSGNNGGSIRNLVLSAPGGAVFNIDASSGTDKTLVFQNSIVANSGSVGTLSNFFMVFSNIIQFTGNTNGITYNNITKCLLSNQGWFPDNSGIFEKLTGNFLLIQKVGGFAEVPVGATGFDVTGISGISVSAMMQSVEYSGAGTRVAGNSPWPGFNFSKIWHVDGSGIPVEKDDVASGNIFYNGAISIGFAQTVSDGNKFNLSGDMNSNTTSAVKLFRMSSPVPNRLQYDGHEKRVFQINASMSARGGTTGNFFAFFIVKNGNPLNSLDETATLMRVNNTSDITPISITGTVEMNPGDFIEIWGQRLVGSGTSQLVIFSLNMSIN